LLEDGAQRRIVLVNAQIPRSRDLETVQMVYLERQYPRMKKSRKSAQLAYLYILLVVERERSRHQIEAELSGLQEHQEL